jgi:hypothetical protein
MAPGMTSSDEVERIPLRLPATLIAAIDERAKLTGRSRNAWIQHALTYMFSELPTNATPEQRLAMRQRWDDREL